MVVTVESPARRIEFQRPSLSTTDLRRIASALTVDCISREKIEIASDCFSRAYEACRSRNWRILDSVVHELSSLTSRAGQTLLTHALCEKDRDTAIELIGRGVSIQVCEESGKTPLEHVRENFLEPECSEIIRFIEDKQTASASRKSLQIELLAEIDVFIHEHEEIPLERAVLRAHELLDRLNVPELWVIRRGAVAFLKFSEKTIFEKAVTKLSEALISQTLQYDIDHQQAGELVLLDEHLGSSIELQIERGTHLFLPLLLDLYQDLLEHFWLLPYFDPAHSHAVIQASWKSILERGQKWVDAIKKNAVLKTEHTKSVKSIRIAWKRIASPCPRETAGKLLTLKPLLTHLLLMGELATIYLDLSDPYRSIRLLERALIAAKDSGDRVKRSIYGNLGIAYRLLGDCLESIEYQEKALKMSQEMKDKEDEGRIYGNLGNVYDFLGDYRKAIEHHEKALEISQTFKDKKEEGRISGNLGSAYHSLGDYSKAIEHHKKALEISKTTRDKGGEGVIYRNLGNTYQSLGGYRKAIEYCLKALEIFQTTEDKKEEGATYGSLGNDYSSLGDYRKAKEYVLKALEISKAMGDKRGEGNAYGNLGTIYFSLRDCPKAIEHHLKALKISQVMKDKSGMGKEYGSLGNIYQFQREYPKAIEYYLKALKLFELIGEKKEEGSVYGNLGAAYQAQENYSIAIAHYIKALEISQAIGNKRGERNIYGKLGVFYQALGDYPKAKEYHLKALEISQVIGDKNGEGSIYFNLGLTFFLLLNYSESEKNYRQSIAIFALLQRSLSDNPQHQITIFEEQSKAYVGLERILLAQDKAKTAEAVNITDSRRSRALADSISRKHSLSLARPPLGIEQIQRFAQSQSAVFVIYSLAPHPEKDFGIGVWVITSTSIEFKTWSIDVKIEWGIYDEKEIKALKEGSSLSRFFEETYPFCPKERIKGEEKTKSGSLGETPSDEEKVASSREHFISQLSRWYKTLIKPIEEWLPEDPTQTITIVPDEFLGRLPFAAFWDETEEEYFIEKHPVSVIPSIQTLQLLSIPRLTNPEGGFALGNPDTGDRSRDLIHSEDEKKIVSRLLGLRDEDILMGPQATVERTLSKISHARWIHFDCHGKAGEKPLSDYHTVFEGRLDLAIDPTKSEKEQGDYKNGHLFAAELAKQKLQAELVFLSACFSGTGKVQQEGVIGPVWSLLAAGAQGVVATHWALPQSALTLKMIETFYAHMLGADGKEKLPKARALQQAMLLAIREEKEVKTQKPDLWGCLYFSGFDPAAVKEAVTLPLSLD